MSGGAHNRVMAKETAIKPASKSEPAGADAKRVARTPGIQVIARAAAILRALEASHDGMSLGDVAARVGLARSTVQRIVNALAAEGFVSASGARSLRIGHALASIAAAANTGVAERIAPHLRALGAEVGETVDLALLSGGSAVFVDQVPGRQRLVALSAVGERFPLHCTANGKAILSCFSQADALELVARSCAAHPAYPLKSHRALQNEIARTRESHLAFDMGEHGEGICAIGIALLDAFGRPVAISIPVPQQRFNEARETLAQKLLAFRKTIKPLLEK